MSGTNTITKTLLTELETTIETGLQTFYEVGSALKEIRDSRAYKLLLGFGTFEDYCREQFSISRSYAYQKIDASDLRDGLSAIADIFPTNESQCRPLTKLEPEQRIEAWQTVLDKADGSVITAKLVTNVVNGMVGVSDPAEWTLDEATVYSWATIDELAVTYTNARTQKNGKRPKNNEVVITPC